MVIGSDGWRRDAKRWVSYVGSSSYGICRCELNCFRIGSGVIRGQASAVKTFLISVMSGGVVVEYLELRLGNWGCERE